LLKALIQNNDILCWATTSISPLDISKGMTRRRPINLNTQSTAATIGLIEGFLAAGVDVTEVRADTANF
jgi:ribonuclease H2 subunit A